MEMTSCTNFIGACAIVSLFYCLLFLCCYYPLLTLPVICVPATGRCLCCQQHTVTLWKESIVTLQHRSSNDKVVTSKLSTNSSSFPLPDFKVIEDKILHSPDHVCIHLPLLPNSLSQLPAPTLAPTLWTRT